jgi:DNA-directed RNA polymerase subunit L
MLEFPILIDVIKSLLGTIKNLNNNAQKTKEYYERRIDFFNKVAFTLIILGFLIFLFGVIVLAFDIKYPTDPNKSLLQRLNEIGQFYSGTVMAFWALAGLIFVYVGFIGQQLQQFNDSNKQELQKGEKFKESLNILKKQYLENLDRVIYSKNTTSEQTGKIAVKKLYTMYVVHYNMAIPKTLDHDKQSEYKKAIGTALEKFLRDYDMIPLINSIVEIIDIIDKSNFDISEKHYLVNKFIKELNRQERCILFYYGMNHTADSNEYKILKKYLQDNIKPTELINPEHIALY